MLIQRHPRIFTVNMRPQNLRPSGRFSSGSTVLPEAPYSCHIRKIRASPRTIQMNCVATFRHCSSPVFYQNRQTNSETRWAETKYQHTGLCWRIQDFSSGVPFKKSIQNWFSDGCLVSIYLQAIHKAMLHRWYTFYYHLTLEGGFAVRMDPPGSAAWLRREINVLMDGGALFYGIP